MKIKDFMKKNYRHFNAAVCVDAAQGWIDHLAQGGKMFITIAGAMSTAELGISLAEIIRQGKVHGICCTGANLEEDIYNLVAHEYYERVPHYRTLKPEEEIALRDRGLNRVTDTCIPEDEAKYYEGEVHGGRFLVTVDAGNRQSEAWSIMHRAGGYNRTNPPLSATAPV